LYLKSLEFASRVRGEEHPETLAYMTKVARRFMMQSQYQNAESLYLKVLEVRKRTQGEQHPETLRGTVDLVMLYEAWGKADEAAKWRSKLPADKPLPQEATAPR
jgi:hypothetical protein